jgi:hypothetical protein
MMQDELIIRAAESAEDLGRLRAYLAGLGAAGALDRHTARPRYRLALTRIAERAGQVVGCGLLAHRRLGLGAATIEAGHVELLGGADAFEALLGECLRVLSEEALPLATIDGPRETYGQFGFAPYRFVTTVELGAGAATTTSAGTLRPAGAGDLDDLAALYAATYRGLPLAEVRAVPDWHWRLRFWPVEVMQDSRGRVTAYAIAVPGLEGSVRLAEAAAADAGEARRLLAVLRQAGSPVIVDLPLAHPVAQAALHLGGTARVAAAPEAGDSPLAGVVDLPAALEALAPEFERRLAGSRYAGWSGNLRVEIETERITLALEGGRATVIDGSRPADVRLRRVELPALAQLCLGYRAAADLRATGELDCDDSALGLLDALFPLAMI